MLSTIIPFRPDRDFIDRGDFLERIDRLCSEPAGRAALVGLGGIGKSQLAIEYAHRVRGGRQTRGRQAGAQQARHRQTTPSPDSRLKHTVRQRHCQLIPWLRRGFMRPEPSEEAPAEQMPTIGRERKWVFWVHASTLARIEEGFQAIADAVKVPGRNNPKADILQLVHNWLGDETKEKWLLVLDSLDNDAVLNMGSNHRRRHLSGYLPQSSNGSLLITTRHKDIARQFVDNRDIIEVGRMDRDDALALFKLKAGTNHDALEVDRLVDALDYIPLAISHAAACIAEREYQGAVARYLRKLEASDHEMLQLLLNEQADLRRDSESSNSVIKTWQISFDGIRDLRPSAATLLGVMSFCASQGIPKSLLLPIENFNIGDILIGIGGPTHILNQLDEDLLVLRKFCMISVNETGDEFETHRLVQLAMRRWLQHQKMAEESQLQCLMQMRREWPEVQRSQWRHHRQKMFSLYPHVSEALSFKPKREKLTLPWVFMVVQLVEFTRTRGLFVQAEALIQQWLEVAGPLREDEDSSILDLRYLEVLTHTEHQWWDVAEKEAELLLYHVRKKTGEEHPLMIKLNCALATIYQGQGRLRDAEDLFTTTRTTASVLFGEDNLEVINLTVKLASTIQTQGRLEEAMRLLTEVRYRYLREADEESSDFIQATDQLARIYYDQGHFDEAEELQSKVLKIHLESELLGEDHVNAMKAMHNLAVIRKAQGRREGAINLMRDCLQRRWRILGCLHPDTRDSEAKLSEWEAATGSG